MATEIPISVLMCVYNTEEQFLRKSIESILKQSFQEFEFIIVSDNPTDNSLSIIQEYQMMDDRIKLIINDVNIGLTKSLNLGLSVATGKYIARMDADDVAFPNRFEVQYRYMESHPETVVAGARTITPGTSKTTQDTCISDQDVLKIRMMFGNPGVPHPTAFIRREVLVNNNLCYNEEMKKSQDYMLWSDLISFGKIDLIPQILLIYRIHDNQISTGDPRRKGTYSLKISNSIMADLIGELAENDSELLRTTRTAELPNNSVKDMELFFDRIIQSNNKKMKYDERKLLRELRYIWSLKTLRRIKKYKRLDLLFSKWFCLFYPSVFNYFIYNRSIHKDYLKMVKKMDQQLEANDF